MKYTKNISIQELKQNYDNIIAWGTGSIFTSNYSKEYFELDYLVDGTGKNVGNKINDIEIYGEEILDTLQGKSIVIIYTIYEKQVLEQIKKKNKDIDVIIYAFVDLVYNNDNVLPYIYSKNCEDMICYTLIRHLGLTSIKFLEIGVCHPIMRNNTYLLNRLFSHTQGYKGVLVEANPLCWNIINDYRENDKLIKNGVGVLPGVLPFYMFPDLLGHSTFDKEIAEKKSMNGYKMEKLEIEVKTLNQIIDTNFDVVPDLLAIDAEGLDFEILNSWDPIKYPFKIIISEIMEEYDSFEKLMLKKGYIVYARTVENVIWVRRELQLPV